MLTTAAHVAGSYGAMLEVEGLGPVEVVGLLWDRRSDIALLDPGFELPATACALPTGARLLGVAPLARPADEVLVYRAGTRQVSKATIESIDSTERVQIPGGVVEVGPLIATASFTTHGDSGALMIDAELRALATLIGSKHGRDYFLPLGPLLQPLGLTLET